MAVSVTGHPKVWVLVLTCPIGKWFTPQCVFEMLIFFCPAHVCPDSEVSLKLVWRLQISVQFPQLLLHWCGHVLCLLSSGVWLMLEQVESGHPHLSSLSYSSQEFYLCAERWASLQVLAAHDVILLYNWGPSLGQKHVRRKTEKQKGMKFVLCESLLQVLTLNQNFPVCLLFIVPVLCTCPVVVRVRESGLMAS